MTFPVFLGGRDGKSISKPAPQLPLMGPPSDVEPESGTEGNLFSRVLKMVVEFIRRIF